MGKEQSVLGYPTSHKEENAGSGNGRYLNFQNGTIIWKQGGKEAFAVNSGIYTKWGGTGYDSGFLGFPFCKRNFSVRDLLNKSLIHIPNHLKSPRRPLKTKNR